MFCNFQTKRSIISKDVLLFCLVYPFSFSFEGVKVEATGKEKIEYLMVSFVFPHHQEQESLVPKSIRNGSRVGSPRLRPQNQFSFF
jgi:hypothetical protein